MGLKRFLIFVAIIFFLFLFSYFYPNFTTHTIKYEKEEAVLLRVLDGDTIEVNLSGELLKVRLLGINAPEKNMPFAEESKHFLEQFVNQTIYLQRDKDDADKYGRKLRYIFYGNRFLNLELLELGFANTYIFGEQAYNTELIRAEAQARNLGLGIWQKSKHECAASNCIILKELNYTADFFTIQNICNFSCQLEGWFVKDSGRNTFYLDSLKAGEAKTYSKKDVWNEDGDKFFMFDKQGFLVIYYEYKT